MLNREQIFEYAFKRYGTKPEYLWEKTPDAAVLRHNDNRKWYAVIMSVRGDRLGLSSDKATDVLSLKCDPIMIGSLIEKKGFMRAYHMNKEKWISVLPENVEENEDVYTLLDMSFELTGIKSLSTT